MPDTIEPAKRAAAVPDVLPDGSVTLINSFVVAEGRDEAFLALWTETSQYFRAQPGFVSLRLHRAVSPQARYRFVNVAVWESAAQFRAAHETDEFRRLVGQPGYREFPSSPSLYQVAVAADAKAAAA
jgi:heme oxygenase (mycobilin-producing)